MTPEIDMIVFLEKTNHSVCVFETKLRLLMIVPQCYRVKVCYLNDLLIRKRGAI